MADDWLDPFTEDQEARERAQRRAERARKRAERSDDGGVAAADVEAPPPAADVAPAPPPPPAPVSGGADGNGAERPPAPPAPASRWRGDGEPPRATVRRRRLIAVFGLLVLAFVALVVVVLATRSNGGSSEAAPATTAKKAKTISVTIPEGYDRSQIAAVAKDAGIRGDYMKASEQAKGFDPAKYGAESPKNLEGFLFPATYDLFETDTVDDLVAKQLDAFRQTISGVNMNYAKSKNLTTYDVLVIASMIEREVQVAKERPLVASVIYNRLSQGIPLGIDATIRFEDRNWDQPLTESRLQEDTPYNTRINAGLPPGPIGNPGLDSIEAAAHPADTAYLYYVVKPGTCGEHVFVKTQAEFDAAVANYNNAREAAGGKSPTDC
jgi:cell division protein YceG involved in septum cleavage